METRDMRVKTVSVRTWCSGRRTHRGNLKTRQKYDQNVSPKLQVVLSADVLGVASERTVGHGVVLRVVLELLRRRGVAKEEAKGGEDVLARRSERLGRGQVCGEVGHCV